MKRNDQPDRVSLDNWDLYRVTQFANIKPRPRRQTPAPKFAPCNELLRRPRPQASPPSGTCHPHNLHPS